MEVFEKNTKNQHFISVSEQKLNSVDSHERKRKKIKIYSFDLIDRETHTIRLSNPSLIKAENNLSYSDLYTFEILDNEQRLSFENLFERLERKVAISTNKIVDNNQFTVGDFLDVFKTKLMNMIRNPYCIKFTLNNFESTRGLYPTDDEFNSKFKKIEKLIVDIETLNKFSVSEDEYKRWLKVLFLMITPLNGEKYILDDFAENFFNLEEYYHLISIFKYTDEVCLLSDRSYVNVSSLFDKSDGVCFGFNLRYDSFIYLTFFPNNLEKLAEDLLGEDGRNIAKFLKETGVDQIQDNLVIQLYLDNLEMLRIYNQHTIYQCVKNVYAAKEKILI